MQSERIRDRAHTEENSSNRGKESFDFSRLKENICFCFVFGLFGQCSGRQVVLLNQNSVFNPLWSCRGHYDRTEKLCSFTQKEGKTMRKVYTPEELSIRWEVSISTIREMINGGRIQAFRIGRLMRVLERDVLKLEGFS